MIQYQKELVNNIKKIVPFDGHCYLQKIYSSSALICLVARFKGRTRFLYLGRGNGIEGFWVADEKIPSELRRIDRFLEYIRKHLGSTELLNIFQVFNDRCLQIVYRKYGYENSFLFFWKGRKLYFLNYFFDNGQQKFYLMKSWHGKKEVAEDKVSIDKLYELLFEIGLSQKFSGNFRDSKTSIIAIIKNEREKLIKLNNSKRKYKSLQRKLAHIRSDLQRVEQSSVLQRKMQMGEFNFEKINSEFIFENINIKLGHNLGPFQKRDRVFEKIKAYKKARKIIEERALEVEAEIELLKKKENHRVFERKLNIIEPYWPLPIKSKAIFNVYCDGQVNKNIKVFKIKAGSFFAIGNNALGNDFLRSKWGHRDDLWFHLDGYRGSHLVVKKMSINNGDGQFDGVDKQSLQVLASALRDFSKLSIEEIPMVFTQVKNVRGIRGEKGKIIYKGEKRLKIEYDKNWKEKIEKKEE